TLAIWHIVPPDEVIQPYDTYLSALSVDEIGLSPLFDPYKQDYYLTLPEGISSLTVSAEASDATSTVSGTGTFDVSGGEGAITIKVTASDNNYTRDYTINYQPEPSLTLMHSYTFADGTARDQVGNADGIIAGGVIEEGVYTASVEGDDYITLPPEELALYAYPSITLEAYVLTGENPGWTMFAYFGGLSGSDVHFLSLAGQTDLSRSVINEGSGESVAGGAEPAAGEYHHYVSVLTNDTIKWYIDGALAASTEINGAYTIHNISTENAWLCKSGYSADPTWLGSIFEFNIYSGQMDDETVASRAYNFPQETAASDATLSDISVNGTTLVDFSPQKFSYNVVLPESTTEVPEVEAVTNNPAANAAVTLATGIPGNTIIEVTSEDNAATISYSVTFSYSLADATLSDLTVDGATVNGFSSEKSAYNVYLPEGTTDIPAVAAVANNPQSIVTIVPAASIPGLAIVTVTAVDGVTVKSYVVSFKTGSSVETFTGNKYKVYPTIFTNSFNVNTAGETCNISVYNVNGKSVLKQKAFNGELEVMMPETGMYIVKIEGSNSIGTYKVIKVK
ncbi:MAG: cadherin-like beta sandwich domain-containing protein, partial [Bacteroidales bacterium]|nr:cadherin-like beta sandwich domain-containing protein [Bacteroidales bacterium]